MRISRTMEWMSIRAAFKNMGHTVEAPRCQQKRRHIFWDYHSISAALGCLLTGVNLLLA